MDLPCPPQNKTNLMSRLENRINEMERNIQSNTKIINTNVCFFINIKELNEIFAKLAKKKKDPS